MRFLADENLELPIIKALRGSGHDVATVPAENVGAQDREVLEQAREEKRILLTNDKDFAELTFLQQRVASGVILIRLPRLRSQEKLVRVLEVIEDQGERLENVMTVIEERAIRRRMFPSVRPRTVS